MNRKMCAVILAVIALLGILAGCGKNKTTTDPETTAGTTMRKDELAGILLLNAGGSVEIMYNVDGTVLSVAGFGENGLELAKEMDTSVGTSCQDTIGVLVQKALDAGFVNADTKLIVLKQGIDSILPQEDFLDSCVSKVESLVSDVKILSVPVSELMNNGYIPLETAQRLLKAYLNMSGDVTFDGPMTATGSKYYLSTQYLEDTVYYTVDASDGTIKACSKEDFEAISTVGFLPEEIEQGNTAEETIDPEYLVVIDPTETTQ